jgi:hypothetical protein
MAQFYEICVLGQLFHTDLDTSEPQYVILCRHLRDEHEPLTPITQTRRLTGTPMRGCLHSQAADSCMMNNAKWPCALCAST